MSISIFDDKNHRPDNHDLQRVLGDKFNIWQRLKSCVLELYPKAEEQWSFTGAKYGWGFRLRDKKRVIIYLGPRDGFFNATLVLGEKATQTALNSSISNSTKKIIENSPVYAEGRGIRIDITDDNLISDIEELIRIKLAK